MAEYYLKLRGAIPSKKNAMERVTTFGGVKTLIIKPRAKAMLDGLQLQLQSLWQQPPLLHPEIVVKFTVSNPHSDRDGLLVSLMDLLQPKAANIIFNDDIEHSNARITIEPADICAVGEELVEIWLRVPGGEGEDSG